MRRIYKPGDEEFDLQLFAGSGAGLNRVPSVLMQCAAATSATYDSMSMYGPVSGVPDVGGPKTPGLNPGPRMTEAIAFSKWLFQLTSNVTSISGWSVAFYGTIDMGAYYSTRQNPPQGYGSGYTFPSQSWCFLESPSGSAGGSWPNPITTLGVMLFVPIPLVAVRVVATATAAVGDIAVLGFAIP